MNDQQQAYIYACIAVFFWATVASAFKIGLGYLSFVSFLFIATVVSSMVFLLLILIRKQFRELFRFTGKQYLFSALLGLFNPFLYYLVLFKAYSLLPAQVAQPLNMVWPVLLVFLSIPMLKQKIPLKSFLALLVSFSGVYLISTQGDPWGFRVEEPLGVALALGSSVIWSFYWLLNVRDRREAIMKLGLSFFFATIYLIPVFLVVSRNEQWSWQGVSLAAYAGVFEMGITFFFWMKALKLTRTTDKISNLVYIAPFLSLFLIHIFVGEEIFLTTIYGLILIVLGIFLEKITFKRRT